VSGGWTWAPHLRKPHGTLAAYRRHFRRGEKPCPACRRANAAVQRQKREAAMAVHFGYVPELFAAHPSCGHREDAGPLKLTSDPAEVTCGVCKQTRPYRTAVA